MGSENPVVSTAVVDDILCVAINSTVLTFGESFQQCQGINALSSVVNCMALSQDSNFLVSALQDGSIVLTYLPLNKCILKQTLLESSIQHDCSFREILFVTSDTNEFSEILVFPKSGAIFQFTNINLVDLKIALEDNRMDIQEVLSSIATKEINIDCFDSCFFTDFENSRFLLTVKYHANLLSLENFNILRSSRHEAFDRNTLVKGRICHNGRYAIILDSSKTLNILCIRTFMIIETWNSLKIDDFSLIETVEHSSSVCLDIKIVILTHYNDDTYLKLCKFPSAEVIYSVKVAPFTLLVEMPPNQDGILFLEGVKNENSLLFTHVKLNEITESSKEARLSHLLNTRQFEAALEFASSYGMDKEIIYKSKVNYLMEQLQPWKRTLLSKDTIVDLKRELFRSLDAISDVRYVVTCCINATLPSSKDTSEILKYAKSKLSTSDCIDDDLSVKVLQTLKKLETFNLVFGECHFCSKWDDFVRSDLWEELLMCLSQHKFGVASLIWEHYAVDFVHWMTKKDVANFLEKLPETVMCSSVFNWLKCSVLPLVLLCVPDSLEYIAEYIMQASTVMELSDKKNWPDNAVSLLQMFLDICEHLSCDTINSVNFETEFALLINKQFQDNNNESILHRIQQLLDYLHDLKELKLKYNCKISLADYSQENKESVIFILLEWINVPEDIPEFINDFLKPFCKQHGIFTDEALYYYIKDVMDHTDYDWRHWEEPSWEKQILTISSCLEEEEFYLKACCQILKVMPVPWSSAVQNMVNDCLRSTHPLVQSIKAEISLYDQNVVLLKYGLQRFEISHKQVSKILLDVIVRQESPTVMEDALVIVKAAGLNIIDAYMSRIRYLVECGKLDDFTLLLEEMPSDCVVSCCKRLALFVSEIYDSTDNKNVLLAAAINALRYLKKYCSFFEYEEYDELLQKFICCRKAQVYFQSTFDMLDIPSSENCQDIFERNVKSFLTSDIFIDQPNQFSRVINERKQSKGKPTLHQLLYMGQLLGLRLHEIWKIIAETAFYNNDFAVVDIACEELSGSKKTVDVARIHLSLLLCFIEKITSKSLSNTSVSQIVDVMKRLQSFAGVYCDESLLETCAYISHWLDILRNLQDARCKANVDFTRSFILSETDPYLDWVFTPIFKEAAIQVSWDNVFAYIKSCMQTFSKGRLSTENSFNKLKSSLAVVSDFVIHLKSKGHLLLAYYVYMENASQFLNIESGKSEDEGMLYKVLKGKHSLSVAIMNGIVNQRQLDFPLLLGYLLSLPVEVSCSLLKDLEKRCGYDYRKIHHIALIGKACAQKWHLSDQILYYQTLQTESEWGRKLNQLQISFTDGFNKPSVEKLKLIPLMANHIHITMPFIKSYCDAFNLDVDEALLSLLDILLTNSGDRTPIIGQVALGNRSRSQTLQICLHIVQKISNKKLLLKQLDEIYAKIDPYNYEVLEFILENTGKLAAGDIIMEESVKNGLALLKFLKNYKRVGEPTDQEIDMWLENSSEVSSPNDRMKERLPYRPLLTPSIAIKILTPELTITTIDIWLKMSSLLKLRRNELIMISVENLVRQAIPKSAAPLTAHETWTTKSPNKNFVVMIDRLISSIDDYEKATVCAASVVKRLPPSASKIFIIKRAIELAKRWWKATNDKKAEQALQVLKKFYVTVASNQVLHTYGLQESHLNPLIEQPEKLIYQLLEHPSIEKRYWFNSGRFPDIHSACERIAGISNFNINSVYVSLLSKWLLPVDYTNGGLDETMVEELNIPKFTHVSWEEKISNDEPNLKRAIYLLQRGSIDDNANHLVKVFRSTSPTFTYRHKWRALKCLLHILNSEEIEDLIKEDINEIRNMMRRFYFGSQLEQLHLPFELPSVNDFSLMRDIVLQLLQSYNHNPTALVLAACICIQFKVFILQIWNTILRGMMDCKLLRPLRQVLFLLSAHSQMMQSSEFFKAWNVVLKEDSLDVSESVKGLNKLILLHRCPIIMELDLLSLAEYFNHASLPVLAVDCFLHLPDPSTRMQHIEHFLNASTVHSTLQHLQELRQIIADLYHLDELSKVIFLAALNNRLILEVKNSPQSEWFLTRMMQKTELNCLLEYAAQNKMLKECFSIMKTSKQYSISNTEEGNRNDYETTLKVYAEMNKLQHVLSLLKATTD